MAEELRRDIDVKVNVSGEQDIAKITKQFEGLRDKIIGLVEADKEESKAAALAVAQIDKLVAEYGQLNNMSIKPLVGQLEYLKNTILTINSDSDEFYNNYKHFADTLSKEPLKPNFDASFYEQADKYFDSLDDDFLNIKEEGTGAFEGLIPAIKEFLTTGRLSQSTVEGLASSVGASVPQIAALGVAFAACIKIIQEYNKAVDEVLNGLAELGVDTAKFVGDLAGFNISALVGGVEAASGAFEDLISICNEAIDTLNGFIDLGEDVGNSLFGIYTYLGQDAGEDVLSYTNKLRDLFGLDTSKILQGLRGILAVTSQLGGTKEQVADVTEALEGLVTDIAAFSGESFDTLASQLENAINLGILNSRSAVAKALDLTDSDIKKYKELGTYVERVNFLMEKGSVINGTYQRYLDSSVGKITALKNAYTNFMNTVGQLVLEIYAVIAPVLTQILSLATKAVEGLAKLFGFDLGSAQSSGAVDFAGKYADSLDNIGNSFDETGKKAEKASKKVASFDDVIQIDDDKNKNKSLADNIGDLSKLDVSSWLHDFADASDDAEFSLDKFKEKIQELLDKFKNWEEGIDFSKLREEAQGLGKDMADLLNIVIDDEQAWHDLGDLMGNSLNTGLEFLNSFADNLHWEQLGKDIGEAWVTFWETLDEGLAADTIASWFNGTIDAAIGFFEKRPLTEFADSFSRIIAGIFNDIEADDIYTLVIDVITDILGAIDKALDNFDENHTGEKLAEIVGNIAKALGEKFPDILSTLSRLLVTELDTLGDLISTTINSFFEGLGEDPKAVDKVVESIINIVDAVFRNIGKIGESLSSHKEEITDLIKKLIDNIANNAETWGQQLKPLVDTIIEALKSIDWVKIAQAIQTFIAESDIDKLVSEWATTKLKALLVKLAVIIQTTLGGLIGGAVDKINGWLDLIEGLISAFWAWVTKTVLEFFGVPEEQATKMGEAVGNTINALLHTIFDGIAWLFDFITGRWDEAMKMGDKISDAWSRAWDSIKSAAESALNWIKEKIDGIIGLINTLKEGLNNAKQKASDWWNSNDRWWNKDKKNTYQTNGFRVPKMAIGGIVTGSTIANIGEDGTEAVLPLEKNTWWMDALASRMAALINNGGGSGNAPIQINLSDKSIYTRKEMLEFAEQVVVALRAYGINVSMAV